MRVNVAIPEAHVKAPVLDAALESVTRLNEQMLAEGAPPFERALKSGVKWQPEPPGAEHFDHLGTILRRGWGDCDDLAPYHAASLRASGEDPNARAVVRRSGPRRWHAVVRRGDGTVDDPSKRAGMNGPHEYRGAFTPLMWPLPSQTVGGAYVVRPQVALRPVRGGWQSRVDIPWTYFDRKGQGTPTEYAMATLHTAPVASTALVGAIDGACNLALVGEYADDEHLDRLSAIADACQGADLDELASIYGMEHAHAANHLVGFFGNILKTITKPLAPLTSLAKPLMPLARMAAPFVPIPGAAAAFNMADSILYPQGGGGPRPAPTATPYAPAAGGRAGRICFPATFE